MLGALTIALLTLALAACDSSLVIATPGLLPVQSKLIRVLGYAQVTVQ